MSAQGRVAESVVARLRPHGRAMFWPSIALVMVIGATAYFGVQLGEVWQNLAVVAAGALLVVLFWLLPLLSWLGHNYTITTRRVVIRHGFIVRVRQELLHSRGYDVTLRQNGLQSLFGSGDVLINTGLEHPIVLRDVPSAVLVQQALQDLMEASFNSVAMRRQQDQSRGWGEGVAWGDR